MDNDYNDTGTSEPGPDGHFPESPNKPVGYGNPPMQRRFKSGESGNKKGRPPGSKNRKTIVREVAAEMHTVVEDGNRRRRSTLELVLLALRNLAVSGNARAWRTYEKYLAKYEPQIINRNGGCLVVPAEMTPEEWIQKMEEQNEKKRRYGVKSMAEVREIERQEREKAKKDAE